MGSLFSACAKGDDLEQQPLSAAENHPYADPRVNQLKTTSEDDPFGIRSPSQYVSRTPMDAASAAAQGAKKGKKSRKQSAAAAPVEDAFGCPVSFSLPANRPLFLHRYSIVHVCC